MHSWLIVFVAVAYVGLITALPMGDVQPEESLEEPQHSIQKRQLEVLNQFLDGRVCEYGVPLLESKLESLSIPNQRSGRISIERIGVTNVNIGGCQVQFSGGLTNPSVRIHLYNIRATVTGRYRYKRWFFRLSGSWTVTANNAYLDFTATAGVDLNSLRVTSLSVNNCADDFTNVSVRFRGSFSAWILNLFRRSFNRRLSSTLEDKVCEIGVPYVENELL